MQALNEYYNIIYSFLVFIWQFTVNFKRQKSELCLFISPGSVNLGESMIHPEAHDFENQFFVYHLSPHMRLPFTPRIQRVA